MENADLIGSIAGSALVGVGLSLYADAICRRNTALRSHRELMFLVIGVWMAMAPAKLLVLDKLAPPMDALHHEETATSPIISTTATSMAGFRIWVLGIRRFSSSWAVSMR